MCLLELISISVSLVYHRLNSEGGIQLVEHSCIKYHLRCFTVSAWLQTVFLQHVDTSDDIKHPK